MSKKNNAKRIRYLSGNANTVIPPLLHVRNTSTRFVLFLDPFGMELEWDTLSSISETPGIDIWYLFPLFGVTRQLSVNIESVDESKSDAINRVLGTKKWKNLYTEDPQASIFGEEEKTRERGIDEISVFVTNRMKEIFPVVPEPLILRNSNNGPMFSLYFLHNSESNLAKGLSRKLAKYILERY